MCPYFNLRSLEASPGMWGYETGGKESPSKSPSKESKSPAEGNQLTSNVESLSDNKMDLNNLFITQIDKEKFYKQIKKYIVFKQQYITQNNI